MSLDDPRARAKLADVADMVATIEQAVHERALAERNFRAGSVE